MEEVIVIRVSFRFFLKGGRGKRTLDIGVLGGGGARL